MTLPASIRVNVSAPFPARVTGADIISVSKANGLWTIGGNYTGLQPVPNNIPPADQILAVYDSGSGLFWQTNILAISALAVLAPYRIITGTGPVAALVSDGDILLNKSVPATTTVTLPASAFATRSISVVDYGGNAYTYNITIVPSGSETINGAASQVITQDNGVLTFYPISGAGWYIK